MTDEAAQPDEAVAYPPCGPSTDKLKTNIANFMDRADEIVAHPLAQTEPSLEVLCSFDPQSMLLTSVNIDLKNLDKATWVYLAVRMRPIVFLEKDDVSFGKLTRQIAREHEPLTQFLDDGRAQFEAWQKHMYIGQQNLGAVPDEHKGKPAGTVTRFELGPPGTVPDEVDMNHVVPDYELARIYFNGHLWHSDHKKYAEFEASSSNMKAFYSKCAEIRTITAIRYVRDLRHFITTVRTHGHDL